MKAYKIQMHQMLLEKDYYAQLIFCHLFNEKIVNDASFMSHLMFSDEAIFHVSGKVSRHNCHIWGTQKPLAFEEHERDSPKVNVWCAFGRDCIIGPFFFEEKIINGDCYLKMLQNYFISELTWLKLVDNTVFQQDGAPCHFSLKVRQFLNERFPNRWIGRGGPISWPPQSPDLSPLDFFLWGHTKNTVYSTKSRSIDDLGNRITDVIQSITQNQLQNVFLEFQNHITACIHNDKRSCRKSKL